MPRTPRSQGQAAECQTPTPTKRQMSFSASPPGEQSLVAVGDRTLRSRGQAFECKTPTPTKKQMSLSAFWGSGGGSSPLPKVLADSSPQHTVPAELAETQSRRKQQGSPSPSRALALRRSKGGRPPKGDGAKKVYVSLTGQQKLFLITKLEAMMREGRSKKKAEKDLMRELGCSLSTVKLTWKRGNPGMGQRGTQSTSRSTWDKSEEGRSVSGRQDRTVQRLQESEVTRVPWSRTALQRVL